MKKIYLRLLSLILMASFSLPLLGEYILYKVDKNNTAIQLTKEEHAKAFNILMSYQFPMNIKFFHGLDQKKWTTDHFDLLVDEHKFIQKKLDDLAIKSIFIPTTLYELYFLDFYLRDLKKSLSKPHNILTSNIASIEELFELWLVDNYKKPEAKKWLTNDLIKALEAPQDTRLWFLDKIRQKELIKEHLETINFQEQDYLFFYDYYYEKISLPLGTQHIKKSYETNLQAHDLKETWNKSRFFKASHQTNLAAKNVHYKINKRIVDDLVSNKNSLSLNQFAMQEKLKVLTQNIRESLDQLNDQNTYQDHFKKIPETYVALDLHKGKIFAQENNLIFLICMAQEIKAHQENKHLLFRGTNPLSQKKIDSTIKKIGEKKALHSISYGCSLFAGALLESRPYGAMACQYILEKTHGYLIAINKADYLFSNRSYQLIDIPPLSTLVSLCLEGENFHARSKIFTQKTNFTKSMNLSGMESTDELIFLNPLYLEAPKNKSQKASFETLFQAYLNEKIIVIKNENTKKRKLKEIQNKTI